MKKVTDGEGGRSQRHEPDCTRPTNARGESTCKCKWRGRLVVGWKVDADGKKHRVSKYVTASTKSGVGAKLRELREQRAAQVLPAKGAPTVGQWLNHWHATILPRTKPKPRTVITYRRTIDSYLVPLLGHIRLDRLTADDIEAAWDILASTGNPTQDSERPLSPSTIHHTHTVLARALRVAVQRKKIDHNPAGPDYMDAPPRAVRQPDPLTAGEWRKVMDAAPEVANAARWRVALALGLRQGEALALRWEDVDLDAGTLRVERTLMRLPGRGLVFGAPKSADSRRVLALPPQMIPELRAHRKAQAEQRLAAGDQWHDSDLVFTLDDGRPIDPRLDARRWKALLEKAGVRDYRLHSARHTAATIQLALGLDLAVVKANMGHSQIATTLGYAKVVDELQRDAAKRVGDAMWG